MELANQRILVCWQKKKSKNKQTKPLILYPNVGFHIVSCTSPHPKDLAFLLPLHPFAAAILCCYSTKTAYIKSFPQVTMKSALSSLLTLPSWSPSELIPCFIFTRLTQEAREIGKFCIHLFEFSTEKGLVSRERLPWIFRILTYTV